MEQEFISGGGRGLCKRGCGHDQCQLNIHDYLADIPESDATTDLVEVQFKNTRKGYYHNINNLPLQKGDIVAVESNPGHDIGTVTLTGKLVHLQIKKANLKSEADIRRIYRIAKPVDMEKYAEAKAREHDTMIQSRQIAKDLGLEMKIGDVEYQGDGNKAIFYYIADGRVDFRQLIKVLAEAFHVRIEMKQIGARQEAGRIGGFGPCGRELCCSTWMRNFVSVSTAAARFQDISLNPQKLAGQCAKLKCCMNYEVDQYVESFRRLPSKEITLQTQDGEYYYFKADILSGMVTYSTDRRIAANLVTISTQRAMDIIAMNRQGERPVDLEEGGKKGPEKPIDLVEQEDLNRFDKKKKKKKKSGNRNRDERRGDAPKAQAEQGKPQEGQHEPKDGGQASTAPEQKGEERPRHEGGRDRRRGDRQKGDRPRGERRHDGGHDNRRGDRQQGDRPKEGNAPKKESKEQ